MSRRRAVAVSALVGLLLSLVLVWLTFVYVASAEYALRTVHELALVLTLAVTMVSCVIAASGRSHALAVGVVAATAWVAFAPW